jgi:hypothetical protein
MQRLLATTAVALTIFGGAAQAQQTSTSDAASNAQQGQLQAQTQSQGAQTNSNGANTNGPQTTTVGPQTSTSNSASGAVAGSNSAANNGGQQTTVTAAPVSSSANDTSRSDSESNSASLSHSVATGGQGGSATSSAQGGSSTSNGGSSNAAANNQASNAGNAQQVTLNSTVPAHTTADVKTVAQINAPALTTTLTDTCMGSSSMSGTGMGWGISIGSTWEDRNCNRRLYAREVASLTGDREAARAVLCGDEMVRKAFEEVGRPCPTPQAAQGPASFVPPPPPPPPNQYLYAAPPPPPPPPPPEGAQQSAPGTMQPIPNDYEGPKAPRN